MTFNEAEERAGLLWQNVERVVRLRYDPERWQVDASTSSGRRVDTHFMDANGHPTCHPACIARENALGVQP